MSVALRSIINQLNRCQCDGLPLSELPEKYRAYLAAPLPAHRRGERQNKVYAFCSNTLHLHIIFFFSHYHSNCRPETKHGHCCLNGEFYHLTQHSNYESLNYVCHCYLSNYLDISKIMLNLHKVQSSVLKYP